MNSKCLSGSCSSPLTPDRVLLFPLPGPSPPSTSTPRLSCYRPSDPDPSRPLTLQSHPLARDTQACLGNSSVLLCCVFDTLPIPFSWGQMGLTWIWICCAHICLFLASHSGVVCCFPGLVDLCCPPCLESCAVPNLTRWRFAKPALLLAFISSLGEGTHAISKFCFPVPSELDRYGEARVKNNACCKYSNST